MGPHRFGQYLHILTPAGSDDSHDGPQPWEGITGRVKQETNRLLSVIERSNTTNKEAIKGVETKLEANKEAIKGVKAQLGALKPEALNNSERPHRKMKCLEANAS